MSSHKIQKWLEEQGAKYRIEAVEARHTGDAMVERFELADGTSNEEFSQRIWESLREDSEAFGTEQIYFLFFFEMGKPEGPKCRKPIRVSGEPAEEVRSTEAPDEKGLAAQAMRHQENNARGIERVLAMTLEKMDAQNDRLWQRINSQADREMDMLTAHRNMMLDQSQLELQRDQQRNEAAIYQKLLEQGELLLPILLSHVMGPKKGSEEAKALQERMADDPPLELKAIAHFLATLSESQRDRIGVVLNMAQRGALQALYKGEILPELVPVTIARVMNGLTREQAEGICAVLETSEQLEAFRTVYGTRMHAIEWQKNAALAEAEKPS